MAMVFSLGWPFPVTERRLSRPCCNSLYPLVPYFPYFTRNFSSFTEERCSRNIRSDVNVSSGFSWIACVCVCVWCI